LAATPGTSTLPSSAETVQQAVEAWSLRSRRRINVAGALPAAVGVLIRLAERSRNEQFQRDPLRGIGWHCAGRNVLSRHRPSCRARASRM
jgi:hypothetical protein